MLKIYSVAAWLALTVGVQAQTVTPITVGTTDTIIPVTGATVLIDITNTSYTATVCLNIGSTAVISVSTCSSGEISLYPQWHQSWQGNVLPSSVIHAISDTSGTIVNVKVK